MRRRSFGLLRDLAVTVIRWRQPEPAGVKLALYVDWSCLKNNECDLFKEVVKRDCRKFPNESRRGDCWQDWNVNVADEVRWSRACRWEVQRMLPMAADKLRANDGWGNNK
jgi:hypothetical protein